MKLDLQFISSLLKSKSFLITRTFPPPPKKSWPNIVKNLFFPLLTHKLLTEPSAAPSVRFQSWTPSYYWTQTNSVREAGCTISFSENMIQCVLIRTHSTSSRHWCRTVPRVPGSLCALPGAPAGPSSYSRNPAMLSCRSFGLMMERVTRIWNRACGGCVALQKNKTHQARVYFKP